MLRSAAARVPSSRSISRNTSSLRTRSRLPTPSAGRCTRRAFATEAAPPPAEGKRKGLFNSIFNLLLVGGVVATGYGVYETYLKPLQWPDEVGADLRAGIKAKHEGDLVTAQSYFQRAWRTAQDLPPDVFGGLPFLKITGIAISLASLYEDAENPEQAYEYYKAAYNYLDQPSIKQDISGIEKIRVASLASKLGEMAENLNKPLQEQEEWLVSAVNTLLKAVQEPNFEVEDPDPSGSVNMLTELDLPLWMSKDDFGAPFEALGEFYSRIGRIEYAMPLYLQAVSILIPPPPNQPRSDEDVCRGAQLMNNIAELVIRDDHSAERLHQAAQWAMRGLAKIQSTRQNLSVPIPTCELALAAALYNNGAIAEYQGEKDKAKDLFQQSLEQSEKLEMKAGVQVAQQGLTRLENGEPAPPPIKPRPVAGATTGRSSGSGGFFSSLFGRG